MSEPPSRRGRRGRAGPDEGWYPDPARDHDTFRWWTGGGWSRWLTTDPRSAPPVDAQSVALEVARPDPSERLPRRVRSAIMLLVVLLLLISAAVLVGWDRRQPVALANPQPSATFLPPEVGRQIEDRAVTINGEVRLDYRPEFTLDPESGVEGLVADCVVATNQGGAAADKWRTYVVIGLAEDGLNDLELRRSAEVAMTGLVAAMNDVAAEDPPLLDLTWRSRPDLGPAGSAGELSGTVRGAFDENLRVIVIDLEHRRRVVYAESTKPNTSKEGLAALAGTRASLRRV